MSAEQSRVNLPDGTEKGHAGPRGEPVSRELDRPSFHQESLHCKSRNPTNWPKQSKGLFTHDLETLEVKQTSDLAGFHGSTTSSRTRYVLCLLSAFFSVSFPRGAKMAAAVPGIPSISHRLEGGGVSFQSILQPNEYLLSHNLLKTSHTLVAHLGSYVYP